MRTKDGMSRSLYYKALPWDPYQPQDWTCTNSLENAVVLTQVLPQVTHTQRTGPHEWQPVNFFLSSPNNVKADVTQCGNGCEPGKDSKTEESDSSSQKQ